MVMRLWRDGRANGHFSSAGWHEACGHAFETILHGSTLSDARSNARVPEQGTVTAPKRAHEGFFDLLEGALAAAHRALLWAAESLVEVVNFVAGVAGTRRLTDGGC